MSQKMYGNLVKAVVDLDRGLMAADVEMPVDAENELLEQGSEQKNLWGIHIHQNKVKNEPIEYDLVINIRPSQGNRSKSVENSYLQSKIKGLLISWCQNDYS